MGHSLKMHDFQRKKMGGNLWDQEYLYLTPETQTIKEKKLDLLEIKILCSENTMS